MLIALLKKIFFIIKTMRLFLVKAVCVAGMSAFITGCFSPRPLSSVPEGVPSQRAGEAAFINQLKETDVRLLPIRSEVREPYPPSYEEPLTSYLKRMENNINSNLSQAVTFRLYGADGEEKTLKDDGRKEDLYIIIIHTRISAYDFLRYICDFYMLDGYELNASKREIIFREKKTD